MGKIGDQELGESQNRTLAESGTNGVEVHLFEVLKPAQYIYKGVVKLCGRPYQEKQKDVEGNMRKVWMFPLKTVHDVAINVDDFDSYMEIRNQKAQSLSGVALKEKATENSTDKPANRLVTSNVFVRDPYVTEYAKARANGRCQLCGAMAPFLDQNGKPYLESHHIIWLSKGGSDSVDNTVALCPNCHRKMHILNLPSDVVKLMSE